MKDAEPGKRPGMYQLTNADGKWEQAAKFDGLTANFEGQAWAGLFGRKRRKTLAGDSVPQKLYVVKWPLACRDIGLNQTGNRNWPWSRLLTAISLR